MIRVRAVLEQAAIAYSGRIPRRSGQLLVVPKYITLSEDRYLTASGPITQFLDCNFVLPTACVHHEGSFGMDEHRPSL